MRGVDLSDQMVGVYEVDRKSQKWWRTVFYKLLLTAVVNAWILYQELNHMKNLSLKQFMIPLAEKLIASSKKCATIKRRKSCGRPPNLANSSMSKNIFPLKVLQGADATAAMQIGLKRELRLTAFTVEIGLCIDCFPKYHS
nr:unnamed protein product [Callosobruchus analis]